MKNFVPDIQRLEGETVNVFLRLPSGVSFGYRGQLNVLDSDYTKYKLCMSANPPIDMCFGHDHISNIIDTNSIILG